ncbi:MAG: hypothetical protein AB8B85_08530 [Paracoccaceae bacterium]
MILFRILCAILLAWAVNWSLSRPEAQDLLRAVPELGVLAPLAAAMVGYFNLSVRQGWGVIVAFANGVWAGVLAIFLTGSIHILIVVVQNLRGGIIRSFNDFLTVFGEVAQPMVDQLGNLQLLIVSLGATSVVGVVTEVLHWLLVRFRQGKPGTPFQP